MESTGLSNNSLQVSEKTEFFIYLCVQHSKQHHRKNVLLSSFNYDILGFHPQTFSVPFPSRYSFPFGRPEGALKATLSLFERVMRVFSFTAVLMKCGVIFRGRGICHPYMGFIGICHCKVFGGIWYMRVWI